MHYLLPCRRNCITVAVDDQYITFHFVTSGQEGIFPFVRVPEKDLFPQSRRKLNRFVACGILARGHGYGSTESSREGWSKATVNQARQNFAYAALGEIEEQIDMRVVTKPLAFFEK